VAGRLHGIQEMRFKYVSLPGSIVARHPLVVAESHPHPRYTYAPFPAQLSQSQAILVLVDPKAEIQVQ